MAFYIRYKKALDVLHFLWRLMKVVWVKRMIPKAWRRAGLLIQKEDRSTTISQLRPISLLNAEGKIFFSIVGQWVTSYLEKNRLVDTTVQKAGLPGSSGCLKHTSMIWHQIQQAKSEKNNLNVVFLENAFGSVPHSNLWSAKRPKSGVKLTPIRAFMDDITTLTTTMPCTRCLLEKLQESISRARMKIKPSKSRSISITKGKLLDQTFFINSEPIPTTAEKTIKSLGRSYDASVKDCNQVEQLKQDVGRDLKKLDHSMLPGKLKLWCLQFGLVP